MITNLGDDRRKEFLAGELRRVEHFPIWKPFVHRQWVVTICPTRRIKCKVNFDIFLQALFRYGSFQLQLFWPGVCDDEDDPVVGHVVQSLLYSWQRNVWQGKTSKCQEVLKMQSCVSNEGSWTLGPRANSAKIIMWWIVTSSHVETLHYQFW